MAEEDNFLFSYNITSPTAALRRALNRERSNVGRGAYTGRVKDILLACNRDHVVDELIADLQNYERGSQHDETQWLDVGLHACKQLNARRPVIFLTAFELAYAPDFVRRARETDTRSSLSRNRSAGSSPPSRRARQPHTRPGPLPRRMARQLRVHIHQPSRPHQRRTSNLEELPRSSRPGAGDPLTLRTYSYPRRCA